MNSKEAKEVKTDIQHLGLTNKIMYSAQCWKEWKSGFGNEAWNIFLSQM